MTQFIAACLLHIGFCQVIPKKVNLIIVKHVGFNKVATALTNDGFFLDKKDLELGTLVTMPKRINYNTNMIIMVRVKDSVAYIQGQYKVELLDNEFAPIENRGMNRSPAKETFNKINDFAIELKGEIEYKTQ